jgi:hypothetical protein
MNLTFLRLSGLLALILCCVSPSLAATARVLQIDMPALIDKVADQPERFAVDVPQRFSTSTEVEWNSTGSTRTWTYSGASAFSRIHVVLEVTAASRNAVHWSLASPRSFKFIS